MSSYLEIKAYPQKGNFLKLLEDRGMQSYAVASKDKRQD